MLTPRQIDVLKLLRRYFYLRTAQVRDALIPHDGDASITRSVLRKLEHAGLIRRHQPKMVEPLSNSAPPVFVLTLKGANLLAAETGDCSVLLTAEPSFRDWMSLNHFCALSALHLMIDAAFAGQSRVRQTALYFEHEVIQPDADEPAKKYRLYTAVSESPRVVCCPDSAFETEFLGERRAWYVEREMGTDTPARVAAKKCQGYAGLAATGLFNRHFPDAKSFRVLTFCPNAGWRDALRREMKDKPGADAWLFAALPEVTAATFLHGPFLWKVDRGPLPLVPPAVSGVLSGNGAATGVRGGAPK
jgi:hypothetical protein